MVGDAAVDCVCGLISVAWLLLGLGLSGRKIYSVGILWLVLCGCVVVAGLLNRSVLVRGVIM